MGNNKREKLCKDWLKGKSKRQAGKKTREKTRDQGKKYSDGGKKKKSLRPKGVSIEKEILDPNRIPDKELMIQKRPASCGVTALAWIIQVDEEKIALSQNYLQKIKEYGLKIQ